MGSIHDLLAADHERLGALLDSGAWEEFRAGLLRHIAIEEKVLLAEAKRLRGGAPLPAAAQLRLDHAAIASMLAASPAPWILTELRALLEAHNGIEEGGDGVYAECERLSGEGLPALHARILAVPPVRLAPCIDPERIRGEIARAVRAAWAARGIARSVDEGSAGPRASRSCRNDPSPGC
jgi:hypothetical protein